MTLPVALINPVTYSPVVANTATFDVPPTPTVTLPPELTTVTFELPLLIFATLVITPVSRAPLPKIYPPLTLAVVVMFAAETNALTTLPLKLKPVAFKLPPPTLPVTFKLPPPMLPVTVKLSRVPRLVMFVWAAVVSVPVILVPDKLPPVMLPTAKINPDATKLAPLTLARVFRLPVATTAPTVFRLPPLTLPAADTIPVANKLPP